MTKRAVFVEAVKPVVEASLVEYVVAYEPSDMRLVLDLFQTDDTLRTQSACATIYDFQI